MIRGLPEEFILFDTEYTTWEGALERGWSGPGEYKEIVEIGAIRVSGEKLAEIDSIALFIKPVKNPVLSEYFIDLTGVTQSEVDEKGTTLMEALENLREWSSTLPLFSFGDDMAVIKENCELIDITFPFENRDARDIRQVFEDHGVKTAGYMSSTIVRAFGKKPNLQGHDALNDARLILEGLRELQAVLEKDM